MSQSNFFPLVKKNEKKSCVHDNVQIEMLIKLGHVRTKKNNVFMLCVWMHIINHLSRYVLDA